NITGERRIHAFRPSLLATEQAFVVISGDHDHHRIDARKMLAFAFLAIAFPAAFGGEGWGAAIAAKSVAAVPFEKRFPGAEDRAVSGRKRARCGAHFGEH